MDSVHYWYQKLFSSLLTESDLGVYVNDQFLKDYPYYQFSSLRKSKNHTSGALVFFDQEPMYGHFLQDLRKRIDDGDESILWALDHSSKKILVVSEKSTIIDQFCRSWKFHPTYYFFHGFAALDWYRNYWKDDIKIKFEHKYLFVSFQHLINHKRSHRVDFLCRLHEKDLVEQGLISFQMPNDLDTIIDNTPEFTEESKRIYHAQKGNLKTSYIDTNNPVGSLSTSINVPASQSAFLQVVTETIFYNEKQHLTEKIFKPVVCKQPFLLLGSLGNLKFFKNYGFQTFSDYWDESYDSIKDPGQRVQAVVDIIENLSKKSHHELVDMKKDMSNILEHNFNHFYHDFKYIIVEEFMENAKKTFNDLGINIPQENWKKFYQVLTF